MRNIDACPSTEEPLEGQLPLDAVFVSIGAQNTTILSALNIPHFSFEDEECMEGVRGKAVIIPPIDISISRRTKPYIESLRAAGCRQLKLLPFLKFGGLSYNSLPAFVDAVGDEEIVKGYLELILLGDDAQPTIDLIEQGASGMPMGINASELQHMHFAAVRWAILNLIPEGLSLLVGKPKCGKSMMALNIALALASGGVFFGQEIERGKVIYLALEDTLRRLQDRINRMLANSEAPKDLILFTEWPRMGQGGIEQLEATIERTDNLRLIIIDTLAKFKPRTKGNSASVYDDDYAFTAEIKRIADKHTVPILAIHHQRKMGGEDIFDTVSGSHGLTGAADAILILTRGTPSLLHVVGRDIEQAELAVSFDPLMLAWNILGKASDVKSTEEKQRLYDAIRAMGNEVFAPSKLTEITGLKSQYVRKSLPGLVSDGVLRHHGRGEYHLLGTSTTMATTGTSTTMATTGTSTTMGTTMIDCSRLPWGENNRGNNPS